MNLIDSTVEQAIAGNNYAVGQMKYGGLRGGTPYMMENKVDSSNLGNLKRSTDPKALEL